MMLRTLLVALTVFACDALVPAARPAVALSSVAKPMTAARAIADFARGRENNAAARSRL